MDLKEFQEILSKDVNGDIMLNSTAIGYMILAAKEAGLNDDIIKTLEKNMTFFMEHKTHKAAEAAYKYFV